MQLTAGVDTAPAYFDTAAYTDSKIRAGMLSPPVAELLGYPSTKAAVDALAAPWHSVDSIFNGADVRQVRAKLEAGS